MGRMADAPPVENGRHDSSTSPVDQAAATRPSSLATPEEDGDAVRADFSGRGQGQSIISRMRNKAEGLGFFQDSILQEKRRQATFDKAKEQFDQGDEEENAEVWAAFLILHPYSTPRLGWDVWVVFLLLCAPPPPPSLFLYLPPSPPPSLACRSSR